MEKFKGKVVTIYKTNKDKNGNIFVLTLKDIIYIIPYEHKRKEK